MTGLTVLDCWKANRVPTFAIGKRDPNPFETKENREDDLLCGEVPTRTKL